MSLNFYVGAFILELAQEMQRVAPAPHTAGSSSPFWVTVVLHSFDTVYVGCGRVLSSLNLLRLNAAIK